MSEYLSNSTRAVCGEYNFSVLTFDHVRGRLRILDRYFADVVEHTLVPRTVLSYRNLRNQIEPALGELKLTELRADHLQRFYA